LSPFSKLPKGNGAPLAIHFYFRRFFWILQAVADTLLHSSKRNQILLEQKQKGPSNHFKQSNKGEFIHLLYKTILTMKADPVKNEENSKSSK
jgi:hypothetical protein